MNVKNSIKVLGLVASYRKLGNTEILVKEALMGAEEKGAHVDIVRLTNLKIEPCRGDALCLFKNQPCYIEDDFNSFMKRLFESDGIILGAPAYILESPAILKQLIDRLFSVRQNSPLRGKPASIIVPYATRGWTPMVFVQPLIFLLWLGMKIIRKELFMLQGIGDVLLDDKSLLKAREMGREIVEAIKTGKIEYKGEPGICPFCHENLVRILKDGKTVECPLCGIRGKVKLVEGKIVVEFDESTFHLNRWSPDTLLYHFNYHIVPSRDFYLRTRDIRREKREKYKNYLPLE